MSPLLARRQERAFERLYRKHVGDVYRYALAVLRDSRDAEQVTQTTFLNAYRGFRRGERALLQPNSLLAIAHDICRLRGGHPRLDEIDLLTEDHEQTTALDIRHALGRLPFDQRAVLVMREVEGRSYAEIAQILALSVGVVEALIFYARQALREELEGSLTCREAELAVSRQLDDRLARKEKRLLRAHLRSCEECGAFARCQQVQRAALRALAAVPLPDTLQSLFGAGRRRIGVRGAVRFTAVVGATALVVAPRLVGRCPASLRLDRPEAGTGGRRRRRQAGAAAAQVFPLSGVPIGSGQPGRNHPLPRAPSRTRAALAGFLWLDRAVPG